MPKTPLCMLRKFCVSVPACSESAVWHSPPVTGSCPSSLTLISLPSPGPHALQLPTCPKPKQMRLWVPATFLCMIQVERCHGERLSPSF